LELSDPDAIVSPCFTVITEHCLLGGTDIVGLRDT